MNLYKSLTIINTTYMLYVLDNIIIHIKSGGMTVKGITRQTEIRYEALARTLKRVQERESWSPVFSHNDYAGQFTDVLDFLNNNKYKVEVGTIEEIWDTDFDDVSSIIEEVVERAIEVCEVLIRRKVSLTYRELSSELEHARGVNFPDNNELIKAFLRTMELKFKDEYYNILVAKDDEEAEIMQGLREREVD